MSEFFAMGGYAEFVWPVFVLGLVTVVFNIVSARRRHRAALERIRLVAARRTRSAPGQVVT